MNGAQAVLTGDGAWRYSCVDYSETSSVEIESCCRLGRQRRSMTFALLGRAREAGPPRRCLTEGGLSVVMLEAGPRLDPDKDFKEHVWPYQLPHRGVGVGGKQRGIGDEFMAPNGYWQIEGEPYTVATGSAFSWFRRELKADGPTIGGGSRCDLVRRTSERDRPMAWATTGRSPMKNWRRITTRWSRISACSGRRRMFRMRRTEFFSRRRSRDAPRRWSRRHAISCILRAFLRGWRF